MTSFSYTRPTFGDPPRGYVPLTWRWYKQLSGFEPLDGPPRRFPFPPDMTPNAFPFSGDPVKRTGFLDGLGMTYSLAAGDRRFTVSSGPFALAPGDTQEVIVAFVAGLAADRLSSITAMKFHARLLQLWYPAMGKFVEARYEEGEEFNPPSYYSLSPNYPNPFSSRTSFDYTLKRDAHVRLSIFDLLGREVAVVEDRAKLAGTHRASWNGRDQHGRALPSGVYFYRLHAGHIKLVRKAVLVH